MTTTVRAHGGGAQPASIDSSGKATGGPALRVYGFDTPEAAQAAGFPAEGGPAMSVAIITDAQLASGAWYAEGDPATLVVYTAPAGMAIEGGLSVPVYPVNGWGSGPAPAPVLPQVASATLLLDLRASQLALNEGDPVSTWADASGNGRDFTQSGDARPTYRAGGGVPYVEFAGVPNQYLEGSDFADNLASFTVFVVMFPIDPLPSPSVVVSKAAQNVSFVRGWVAFITSSSGNWTQFELWTDVNNYSSQVQAGYLTGDKQVSTFEMISVNELHIYTNSLIDDYNVPSISGASDFSISEPVRVGRGDVGTYYKGRIYSVLIYAPAPNATDRAAIETWLATNP